MIAAGREHTWAPPRFFSPRRSKNERIRTVIDFFKMGSFWAVWRARSYRENASSTTCQLSRDPLSRCWQDARRAPNASTLRKFFPSSSSSSSVVGGLGGLKAKIRSYGRPSPPRNPHLLLQVSKPQERNIAKKKTVWQSRRSLANGIGNNLTKYAFFPRQIPSTASLPAQCPAGRVDQPAHERCRRRGRPRVLVSAFPRSTSSARASCCSAHLHSARSHRTETAAGRKSPPPPRPTTSFVRSFRPPTGTI